VKDYNYRTADEALQAQSDDGDDNAYGAVYAYGDNYLTAESDDDAQAESGLFYARLRHERLLNQQHQVSGESNGLTLAPGQMLEIAGSVPESFAKGVV
ncbi:contractile injection system protein, VgrG/Pvc8 family, partial [Brenneria populi]|nr:contractile injection system protein, VgrG/Pvc8 family [Brenneria populi Li et al. 2015]